MTNDEYLLASNQGILIALAREGKVDNLTIGIIESNYKSRGIENNEFIIDLRNARIKFLEEDVKHISDKLNKLNGF